MKVEVTPKTKHIKDLVKQHGKIWIMRDSIFPIEVGPNQKILETLEPVHNNKTHPFAIWVEIGKDCDVQEVLVD